MTSRLISNLLGYLGLIPFAAGAGLILSGSDLLGIDATFVFISYSSIILSFLGGVLWGRGLATGTLASHQRILLVISNGLALLGWFSLLAVMSDGFMGRMSEAGIAAALMVGYLVACAAEVRWAGGAVAGMTGFYLPMRVVLTALVVAIHGVVVWHLGLL